VDAPELLDVDVEQLAQPRALVALRGLQPQPRELAHPDPGQDARLIDVYGQGTPGDVARRVCSTRACVALLSRCLPPYAFMRRTRPTDPADSGHCFEYSATRSPAGETA
jgi:hypothetical protein